MAGGALCWLAVAVALSVCCDGLCDFVTWPGCPASNRYRVVNRGEADHERIYGLDISRCNITSLKSNELVYPKIAYLEMGHNNIEFVETGAFDYLSGMYHLFINNITFLGKDLPSSLFRNCHKLNSIKFSSNDMSDTPADLLQGLNNLKELLCDNCSLNEIPTFIRSGLPVESLHLEHNQLTRLDNPVTFVNLTNLKYLRLGYNKIVYLHEDILRPLANIQIIHMESNKIRRIPEQLFQDNSRLWYINLANNLIDYIPEKAFLGTNLHVLYISNNKLAYLSEDIFSGLGRFSRIQPEFYFDGNPLPCAYLNELLVKLKQLNIRYVHSAGFSTTSALGEISTAPPKCNSITPTGK